jgi:hypothetical protein
LKKYYVLGNSIILAIFLLAYHPTLFNFFLGDDFLYSIWADIALKNPKLLLAKYWDFWHVYLTWGSQSNLILAYRPLFHTMIFFEYKFFGLLGLYYRLINMATELLSGIALALVVVALNKRAINQIGPTNHQLLAWAICSAVLFIFYPLHSEPVNYISAGMDPLVTLFSLLSLWCYIQWRTKSNLKLFILSIISTVFAFLTKEMAVTVPPIIFIYELLFQRNTTADKHTTELSLRYLKAIYMAFFATLPYWLILVLYFCLRKLVLGDFIAGYPDNVCYPTIEGWLRGLRDIFIPINTLIIGTHSNIFKMWHIALVIMVLLSTLAIIKTNRDIQRIIYFLVIWFLLALAPVYKLFPQMMSCGSGSRLAYIATAPLCVLLTYGAAIFSIGNRFSYLIRFVSLIFFALAVIILHSNNIAWAAAGKWTNNVIQELRKYYSNKKGDPLVYISNLPVFYENTIYCMGRLDGITKKPIIDRDISNCQRLDYNEQQMMSIGFLKDAAANHKKDIHLLYWDSSHERLLPVSIPPQNTAFACKWQGDALKQIIQVIPLSSMPPPEFHWLSDGTLELISHTPHTTLTAIELNLPRIPCWNVDFLALKIQFAHNQDFSVFSHACLVFTNNLAKGYSKDHGSVNNCCSPINPKKEQQEIIFPLRNIAAWTMGGKCSKIKILLPIDHSIKISEISIPKAANLIPRIYLQQSINDPPGQVKINNKDLYTQNIQYDAHLINGANETLLEVIPVSQSFENICPPNISKMFYLKKNFKASDGQFTLNRIEFPNEAVIYKARIRVLDKLNNQIGLPSDTLFISVQHEE